MPDKRICNPKSKKSQRFFPSLPWSVVFTWRFAVSYSLLLQKLLSEGVKKQTIWAAKCWGKGTSTARDRITIIKCKENCYVCQLMKNCRNEYRYCEISIGIEYTQVWSWILFAKGGIPHMYILIFTLYINA